MDAIIGSVPRETLPNRPPKNVKKTTYEKITNDGVYVENLDPTGLRKILLWYVVLVLVPH